MNNFDHFYSDPRILESQHPAQMGQMDPVEYPKKGIVDECRKWNGIDLAIHMCKVIFGLCIFRKRQATS